MNDIKIYHLMSKSDTDVGNYCSTLANIKKIIIQDFHLDGGRFILENVKF